MKPREALNLLDKIAGHPNLAMNRDNHDKISEALAVLEKLIPKGKRTLKKKAVKKKKK